MDSAPALAAPSRTLTNWLGWSAVLAASLAMAATLPGRTHGLGLIEKRLVADFAGFTDTQFAWMNLAATLIGALFCFPCGWLIDRYGPIRVGIGVLLALGGAVLWMSQAGDLTSLAISLTLTRGFGQSMLSVVSLAIIGKAFPEKPGAAMGAYAMMLTILMTASFIATGVRVTDIGWRGAWWELAIIVALCAPLLSVLSLGNANLGIEQQTAIADDKTKGRTGEKSATWQQALGTPCFWVFGLGIAFFSLVSTGISLFQERLLEARGQTTQVYQMAAGMGLLTGLLANLLGGWAALHVSLARVLAAGMLVLAGSTLWLAYLATPGEAIACGGLYGVAGGLIMVAFFSVWGQAFGDEELARIQGIAQMLTVLGSSVGPAILTESKDWLGSYQPILWVYTGISFVLAMAAFFTPVPSAADGDWK